MDFIRQKEATEGFELGIDIIGILKMISCYVESILGRAKVEAERLARETIDCGGPGEREGGPTLGCGGGREK